MKRSAVKSLCFAVLAVKTEIGDGFLPRINRALRIAPLVLCAALVAAGTANAGTTDLYVKDGLIACWDGIENAGVGQHNDSPSVWVDLVGGLEITIPSWVTAESDGFYSTSSTSTRTYPTISSIPGLGDNVTIEVVAERVKWRMTDNYYALQPVISSPYGSFGYRLNKTSGVYYFLPISTAGKSDLYHFDSDSGGFAVSECHTYAARVTLPKNASNAMVVDGMARSGFVNDNYSGNLPSVWKFFNAQRADIRLHAIRVYNRRLTNDETAANYMVDKRRFIDHIDDSDLLVSSSPAGTGSPSPAYGVTNGLAAGDSFAVSCGATTVTDAAGTAQYSCTGWKLYDWTNAVVSTGAGTSFTYVHPTPAEYRKLEWQWEETAYHGTIAAGYGGAVPQSSTGWFAAGTPVTVTATPNAGNGFKCWTGTLPEGISATSASVTFTPTAPFSMTAVFETVGSGGLVFFNEKTSSYWHTATNCVIDLPIEFPAGASSATLSVAGIDYSAQYAIPSGTAQYTLSLPAATSSTAENVYDLALAFNDSASTVRTAKLGLIYGHDATTTGWTRCLAPAGTRAWSKTKGVAVIPIPYGTTSFTIALDGGEATSTDTGLDGAAGWYPLRLKGETTADLAATTLEGSLSANLRGDGAGFFLIVR